MCWYKRKNRIKDILQFNKKAGFRLLSSLLFCVLYSELNVALPWHNYYFVNLMGFNFNLVVHKPERKIISLVYWIFEIFFAVLHVQSSVKAIRNRTLVSVRFVKDYGLTILNWNEISVHCGMFFLVENWKGDGLAHLKILL